MHLPTHGIKPKTTNVVVTLVPDVVRDKPYLSVDMLTFFRYARALAALAFASD